jgi:hypothetical protein
MIGHGGEDPGHVRRVLADGQETARVGGARYEGENQAELRVGGSSPLGGDDPAGETDVVDSHAASPSG